MGNSQMFTDAICVESQKDREPRGDIRGGANPLKESGRGGPETLREMTGWVSDFLV